MGLPKSRVWAEKLEISLEPDIEYTFNGTLNSTGNASPAELTGEHIFVGTDTTPDEPVTAMRATYTTGPKEGTQAILLSPNLGYGLKLDIPIKGNSFTISFDVSYSIISSNNNNCPTTIFFVNDTGVQQQWISIGEGWHTSLKNIPAIWGRDSVEDRWYDVIPENSCISLNKFVNVTVVFNGGFSNLYLNGNLVASGEMPKIFNEKTEVYVGVNAWDKIVNASIANVKFYEKALNENQVNSITNAITLTQNQSKPLNFGTSGTNLSEDQVSIVSQDESVAKVTLGNVGVINSTGNNPLQTLFGAATITGIAPGETQVTLTYPGVKKTIIVTVTEKQQIDNIEYTIPEGFEETVYRANYLCDSSMMEPVLSNLISTDGTPGRIYLDQLNDSLFNEGVGAWEAAQSLRLAIDDPSGLGDKIISIQDMYTGLVFQTLQACSEVNAYSSLAEAANDIDDFMETYSNVLKADYNIDMIEADGIEKYKNLSFAEKGKLNQKLQEAFQESFPVEVVSDAFNVFSRGMEFFDSLESYMEYIYTGVQLMSMTDSMKTVVQELYNQCPDSNTMLKYALSDCVDTMNASTAEFMAKAATKEFQAVGWQTISYFMDEFWGVTSDVLMQYCPGAALLVCAANGATMFSNALFSTDDTVDSYYKMRIMTEIENLAYFTYRSLKDRFQGNHSRENAETLLSCAEFIFSVLDTDCIEAQNFAMVIDNAAISKIAEFFGCGKSAEEIEAEFSIFRSRYD